MPIVIETPLNTCIKQTLPTRKKKNIVFELSTNETAFIIFSCFLFCFFWKSHIHKLEPIRRFQATFIKIVTAVWLQVFKHMLLGHHFETVGRLRIVLIGYLVTTNFPNDSDTKRLQIIPISKQSACSIGEKQNKREEGRQATRELKPYSVFVSAPSPLAHEKSRMAENYSIFRIDVSWNL